MWLSTIWAVIILKKFYTVILFLVIALSLFLFYNKYTHTFSQKKWEDFPARRYKISSDLLENYKIIGLQKNELIELLGEDYIKNEKFFSEKIHNKPFDLDTNVVYYIGNDLLDARYIIFHIDNEVVIGYSFGAK